MAEFFDEAKWQEIISQPDWYLTLYPALEDLRKQEESSPNSERAIAMKREVRDFFETNLRNGTVALARSGPNLDTERQAIDTIVIHHTSAKPGYKLPYMNAVQMLNVYVPYFVNPTDENEKNLRGQPLWSNHVRDSRPVFYLYHWLMRMDGSFERLLEDNELGWHAANLGINRRSVAICLDNDYVGHDPSPKTLRELSDFIVKKYPQVSPERIFGHSEVSHKKTVCPGTNFVANWKNELLKLVRQA